MNAKEFRRLYRSNPKWASANKITDAIVDYLNLHGHFAHRQNNVGVFDQRRGTYRAGSAYPGVPDIIGVHKDTGQFIGIEVKAKGDRLSESQKRYLEDVRQRGGIALVARSLDDVMARFDREGHLNGRRSTNDEK